MGVLLVKCPISGREFSTGIQIDQDSLGRLPESLAKAKCPHCAGEHTWWTREARLVDEVPPNLWVEAFDHSR
jgi:hypothetical protein